MKRTFPGSFYNPLTLGGAAVASLSLLLIAFLILLETFAARQKPYMGIIAFVILPAFLIVGLVLVAAGVIREQFRRDKAVSRGLLPVIDLNNTRHQVAFLVFSVGTVLLLMLTAFGSYKAYEYTDSDQFCGEVCHKVMEPEYTAYRVSPHARVGCVECHIGPGAGWFVRSKISGAGQVYATVLDRYPQPIPTPVANLRPAQQTCEQCHWPRYFISEALREFVYFPSDDVNAKWTLTLLMKIGGGTVETGPTSGIHWHMNILNEVTYVASDPRMLVIPWVQARGPDGSTRTYRSPEWREHTRNPGDTPTRRMDCIDCHNRPTHVFHNPSSSVNRLMAFGRIDAGLPNLKSLAVAVLEKPRTSRQDGLDGIRRELDQFYRANYPDLASAKAAQIETAVVELQRVYALNYFPAMKVNWKVYPNHIGHLHAPGCFRCHDGKHADEEGRVLPKDCNLCHVIVAQEFARDEKRVSLSGLEYRHPVDVGSAWKEVNCNECHGRSEGP
jgi:hypothetical protein